MYGIISKHKSLRGLIIPFTIIIPFYNGHDTINKLIESIPSDIPILVVDDHSKQPLRSLPYDNVSIIKASKRGYFAGAVNTGIKYTDSDVLILNQDTYFSGSKWLVQLENCLDGEFGYFGERIQGVREDWVHGYIHGTYMYLTRDTINKTGLLNEELFPMWGCTAEYQLRVARNNIKILPLVEVEDFIHIREGGFGDSFKQLFKEEPENKNLFVQTPPLVSVVIPTHNFSTWLSSAINSLVGGDTDLGYFEQQTFASFEVIIVDDSSTDDTPQIIESLTDGWKGVRSIRLDRPRDKVWHAERDKYIGKTVAMNEGIKSAYGKYILVLDADDMMETNRIEQMFKHISKNPTSVVYDNMRTFTDGVRTKEWRVGAQQDKGIFYDKGAFNFAVCLYKNQVHFSTMFAKTTWEKVGGYCERMLFGREDWHFAINCASNGFIPFKLDSAGFLYRRDGQNRTLVNAQPDWMNFFQKQMFEEFTDLYRKTPKPKQENVWF